MIGLSGHILLKIRERREWAGWKPSTPETTTIDKPPAQNLLPTTKRPLLDEAYRRLFGTELWLSSTF